MANRLVKAIVTAAVKILGPEKVSEVLQVVIANVQGGGFGTDSHKINKAIPS